MSPNKEVRQKNPTRASRSAQKLTVVVPAYNEAGNIASLVQELAETKISGLTLDFVVVDDGSADDTARIAREAGATVVRLPFNLGIGISVQTGFCFAVAHGADFVAQVDGDGQHIPAELEKILQPLRGGSADMAIGSRFAVGTRGGIESTTFARWLAGRLLSVTVRILTGKALSDTTSGFRVFNRKAAEYVAENYPDDYPEVQVLVALSRLNYRIVEVPVRMRSREHGRSSIHGWRPLYYVVKVIFASFMDRMRR